ncbi:CASTOR/POLLUX-related putative ion channel [Marinobacter sp. SS21]|uniref:CASTOR/POLLUX-related putative ion channel n=1 Tax=Marinobacter sp. SS21 TaxID=2979460 RepID=UPI00232B9D79|nr:ion channel DMI1 [Marinobacter sp. SS21]MDC0662389.1 ion channel DMI1 [Marinobacter sp. SS21]
MLPLRFVDRLKFFIERQFVKGAAFQLLVVALLIGLISVIGGLLVAPLGEPFDDLGAAIWWAFLRLTDPGYLGDDSGNWQRFVSTLLTVSGYVVFLGALVAILTRWLIAVMNDLERGLTPVSLKHHVVVLGWTSLTLPLLSELLGSSRRMRRFLEQHDTRRLRLVVLAAEVSANQMLALRNQEGIGSKVRQIILRSGLAIQPEALHRVACLQAAAVIIPSAAYGSESLVSADVETVKALLSIAAQARQLNTSLPFVVAEIQDLRKRAVIERAYPGAVEVVAGDSTISRLIVQNCLHPGLSELYNELLTAGEGNELYIRSGEPLAGLTLGEVASQRPAAIVLGLLRPAGNGWQACLLGSPGLTIAPADRLVMMARGYDDTEANSHGAPLAMVVPAAVAPCAQTAIRHRVLVLGWGRKVPALVAEFDSYAHRQFELDLVSVMPTAERERIIQRDTGELHHAQVRHLEADYMVEGALRRLKPWDYDTILLLSSDRLASGEEADARAMVGYLQLEELLMSAQRRPQVILELSDPDNQHLLGVHQGETIVSPMVMSHVLAQVALRRELRWALDELFTAGGAEFQFRDPDGYTLPADADFQRLEQAVADNGELALGLYRRQPDARGRRLRLNPPRDEPLDLEPGDRLVVLALT